MFSIFKKYPNLITRVSQKSDGNMKIFSDSSLIETGVLENRRKYFSSISIEDKKVTGADLVHGDKIAIIAENDGGKIIPETDALITDVKNSFLSVTVADCLPIFIFDPKAEG